MAKLAKLALVRILLFTALPIILIDQSSKMIALAWLNPGQYYPIMGKYFGITLIHNPGAAFSFLSHSTWIFTVVALAVIAAIVYWGRLVTNHKWQLALGMLAGGAVGNLIDRLIQPPGVFHGHVIDFLSYYTFFVGNLADIAIVAAVGLILVLTWLGLPTADSESTPRTQDLPVPDGNKDNINNSEATDRADNE